MKFNFKGQEYYIDGLLARQMDTLIYNVKDDYDFVIIITGDRSVRVGKSVLAMTVCAYLSEGLRRVGKENKYEIEDVYFDNADMMKAAFKKPPYHVNHYDEGREGLAANKAMKAMSQDLLDFFAECGQLNHIFVIVAPDFFKLNEEIAVARSEYLINVYRKEQPRMIDLYKTGTKVPVIKLARGQFEFFDRKKKQNLYDKSRSTNRKNYGLIKANFVGAFANQYPLGEEEYRKAKKEALSRFTEKKKAEKNKETKQEKKWKLMINALAKTYSHKQLTEIAQEIGLPKESIYRLNNKIEQDIASERMLKQQYVAEEQKNSFQMPK